MPLPHFAAHGREVSTAAILGTSLMSAFLALLGRVSDLSHDEATWMDLLSEGMLVVFDEHCDGRAQLGEWLMAFAWSRFGVQTDCVRAADGVSLDDDFWISESYPSDALVTGDVCLHCHCSASHVMLGLHSGGMVNLPGVSLIHPSLRGAVPEPGEKRLFTLVS
eukprot:5966786-Amphidinium_carterae.1